MITLANIKRAIYCLNKRIDLLEQNGGSGGVPSSEIIELQNKVTALESIISEGENPTAAIDKFNEIVAFLNSIQNTDTLSGLLQDIISQIPDAQIQSDWNQTNSNAKDFIKNKPTLFSGDYNDLSNKPTIPTKISNLQDDSNFLQIPYNQNVFVDMGLPSGVKWASRDIDLTKPGGFCETPFIYEKSFFSWGNIDGYNPSSVSAFDYNRGSVNQAEPWYDGQVYGSTPGNTLTGNIAVGEDFDAARANLGALWRMPTNTEYGELFANIKYINADGTEVDTTKTDKRVNVNGVMGLYLESRINGARLFFSCSGFGSGRSWVGRGSNGFYWSSSWYSARNALSLRFYNGEVIPQNYNSARCSGFAVRPVLNPTSLKASKVALTGNYEDLNNKPTIPVIWSGTQAQYDAITIPDNNTIYIITPTS